MAFVAGKNTLSSGTGSWTLVFPADATIAIDDPDTRNPILAGGTPVPQADFALFPTVQLVITLTADGTSVVQIVGDGSTERPDPPDSIGFTANMQLSVVNNTGHALSGLTFNLTNVTPALPYNTLSSVIDYGEQDYDANYAYLTMIQPVAGEAITLFTPTGVATNANGAAPSEMVLTGNIAAGDTVTSDFVMHNTELATTDNDFDLSVTDSPATVTPPPPPPPPPPPVTLPPIADMLLQNPNGQVAMWQMNGDNIVGGGLIGGNVGQSWHIKGTGALYGADTSGILWQNDDGSVAMWQMNGATTIGGAVVNGNPGPTWHIEGTGDFYGDGYTSILWQNDNGAVALWDMNGATPIGGAVVSSNPGPSWHIEGNADFYGDGHQAILWQNDEGAVALWDMDGATPIAGAVVADPGPTWHIKGTGDFYGDGHQDILFQNDNGDVALWEMSGSSVIAAGVVDSAPGPTWHVEGTGDFNGDGHTDIEFQNDNGSVAIWDMNGTNIVGGGLVGNPGTTWNVANDSMQFIQGSTAPNLTASAVSQDEFVFRSFTAGAHSISGFNPVQDIIEFSAAQFPTFAAVQAATTAVAGGAMINLGNGSSLSLPGINPASLHASDFALT